MARLYRYFDILVGSVLLLVLLLMSLFSAVVSPIQTILLFNDGVVQRMLKARTGRAKDA
jgi:hypothetical protein